MLFIIVLRKRIREKPHAPARDQHGGRGYKSSIAICRRYGFICRGKVTDGARFDGRMLRDVVTNDNTASDVWADTAYRSRSHEAWLKTIGRVSRVHAKKPDGNAVLQLPKRSGRSRHGLPVHRVGQVLDGCGERNANYRLVIAIGRLRHPPEVPHALEQVGDEVLELIGGLAGLQPLDDEVLGGLPSERSISCSIVQTTSSGPSAPCIISIRKAAPCWSAGRSAGS